MLNLVKSFFKKRIPSDAILAKPAIPLQLVILLFSLPHLSCLETNRTPVAKDGILDLQNWEFTRTPDRIGWNKGWNLEARTLDLVGEWEFFWKTVPRTDSNGRLVLPEEKKEYTPVPNAWNGLTTQTIGPSGQRIEESIEGEGYATYRLKVILKEPVALTLRIPSQGTNYRIFVEDQFLGEAGQFGTSKNSSLPGKLVQYLNFTPMHKEFYILMLISNYHSHRGGFWLSIKLGDPASLNEFRSNQIGSDLFKTGILFIMGIYHLILHLTLREEKAPLYLGIFCSLFSLRIILLGDEFIYNLIDSISFEMMMKLEYLTLYLAVPLFMEFINCIYSNEIIDSIKNLIRTIGYLSSFLIIILPFEIFSKTLLFYQIFVIFSIFYIIYVLVKSFQAQRAGAKIMSFGFFIFGASIINDLLLNNHLINSTTFSPLGFIIFIFSQSIILTNRYSSYFRKTKELSINLENKVKEKTISLEEANSEIMKSKIETDQLNELIRTINSVSSLTDVMTYIMFYLEMNYNFNTFWLLLYNKKENSLKTSLCVSTFLPNQKIEDLKRLDFNFEKDSSLGKVIEEHIVTYYELNSKFTSDNALLELTGLSYHFHIPFLIYGECIGILTLHKSTEAIVSENERDRIKKFADLIAGAVYNSLLFSESQRANELLEKQKTQMEEAFNELRNTQAQLVEAEKLASLGQLIGGIAHEINNPIAVIRSNAELLDSVSKKFLTEIPGFLNSLNPDEQEIFLGIVNFSISNQKFFTTKEERFLRKEVENSLSQMIPEENLRISLADSIIYLRLNPPFDELINTIGIDSFRKHIEMASLYKNQVNAIDSIETAVEKAFRIVFSLRKYLDLQANSQNKKIDLVEELEKALRVYDNLIIGKVTVKKEFPQNLYYNCDAEKYSQVFKNIIFNSIQAMYSTQKNLVVSAHRTLNFPKNLDKFISAGNIDLTEAKVQEWIVIEIKDSGQGIPLEIQDKIFTPFFTTKQIGEGIGLGLYTSKKIIQDSGGDIFFRSSKEGTEFLILLPVLEFK